MAKGGELLDQFGSGGVAEEAVVEVGAFEYEVYQGIEGVPDEQDADFVGGIAREEGEGGGVGC